jgi:hypothetical protein
MVLGLQEETKSEATLVFTGGLIYIQALVTKSQKERVVQSQGKRS